MRTAEIVPSSRDIFVAAGASVAALWRKFTDLLRRLFRRERHDNYQQPQPNRLPQQHQSNTRPQHNNQPNGNGGDQRPRPQQNAHGERSQAAAVSVFAFEARVTDGDSHGPEIVGLRDRND
jgi:hypothetical protein